MPKKGASAHSARIRPHSGFSAAFPGVRLVTLTSRGSVAEAFLRPPKQKKPAPVGTGSGLLASGAPSSSDRRGVEGAQPLLRSLGLERNGLAFAQVVAARRTGDVAYVQEDVLTALLGLDEAKSLLGVKPLNRSALHTVTVVVFVGALRRCNARIRGARDGEAAKETQMQY